MIEKQNDLKEVIVHLRTPSGGPPTGQRDLSGKGVFRMRPVYVL